MPAHQATADVGYWSIHGNRGAWSVPDGPPLSYLEKPYTSKDARLREEHLNAGQTFACSHS